VFEAGDRMCRVAFLQMRCTAWFPTAVLFAMAPYAVTAANDVSSREAWLQAPFVQGKSWSREALLERLAADTRFAGMTRQRVIDLLGAPGFASED